MNRVLAPPSFGNDAEPPLSKLKLLLSRCPGRRHCRELLLEDEAAGSSGSARRPLLKRLFRLNMSFHR